VDSNVGETLNVFATGCDDEAQIRMLRIFLNSDSYVQFEPKTNPLNGQAEPCVTGLYEITPFKRGVMKVFAQVQSLNGSWGASHEKNVIIHDFDNLTNPGFNPNNPAFLARLTDARYPVQVGSHINVGVLPFTTGPWWMSFYNSASRVPFNTKNCVPAVKYPRVSVKNRRVFWPQSTTDAILACWLATYTAVQSSIAWQNLDSTKGPLCAAPVECPVAIPQGVVTRLSYANWTPAMKLRLNFEFYAAYRWLYYGTLEPFTGTAIPDVPGNQITLSDPEPAVTLLLQSDAWNLYINNVAHSLAMEIGGFCKFSIVKYQPQDLAILFDSINFFSTGFSWWTVAPAHTTVRAYVGYWISGLVVAPAQATRVMPAPAQTTFAFMVQHDIPRLAGKDVVAQLFTWGRNDTLTHTYEDFDSNDVLLFDDGTNAIGAQTFWQFRGAPTAALIMTGTTMAYPYSNPEVSIVNTLQSWTIGCPCTSFFLQTVLRAHNIPTQTAVANLGQTGHTVPFWFTLGYTMSHGDDLYDSDGWAIPPASSNHFLVSLATFNNWFYGAQMIGSGGLANVGRQPDVEVPLMDLTTHLLQAYCMDKAASASEADGLVYTKIFQAWGAVDGLPAGISVPFYTLAQLQAQNLWTRLDATAATLAMC